MGIHGDKSQQERDWVLNGELSSLIKWHHWLIWAFQSTGHRLTSILFFFSRVQIRKGSDSHCYRCSLQGSRSVSSLNRFYTLLNVFHKESVFAFFNSSASFWVSPHTWRSSLCGRALAWQAQVSRGGRRILGGVLTGEARVSQLCRYTEVTRPKCSI